MIGLSVFRFPGSPLTGSLFSSGKILILGALCRLATRPVKSPHGTLLFHWNNPVRCSAVGSLFSVCNSFRAIACHSRVFSSVTLLCFNWITYHCQDRDCTQARCQRRCTVETRCSQHTLINALPQRYVFDNPNINVFVNGLVTLEKALEASRREAPGPVLAGGSAATQPRLRLFAKCAFEQRFLSKFTRKAWERQSLRGGTAPSGGTAHAERDGRLPFTPCAVSSSALAKSVTNPQKRPRFLTRSFATGRGLNFWGLVTAHSRAPRQRSRPTREPSLGLGLTSALPGGRSVGLSVARHIVLGRWRRARSRRHRGIHVNRIGGRFAGAHLTA